MHEGKVCIVWPLEYTEPTGVERTRQAVLGLRRLA
jgi:hypothetical protein